MPRPDAWTFELTADAGAVSRRLAGWTAEEFADRLWQNDHTIWSSEPRPELADRLGWLDLPHSMPEVTGLLTDFAEETRGSGIETIVLCGMGGSSLAPETFAAVFGPREGFPRLLVLDSTHPGAVRAVSDAIEPGRTLFLIASKSGTTLETLSFFRYFWQLTARALAEPGDRFAAITDSGSALEELAVKRGFQRVFNAPADVGGRFSALTYFGLVPAALIGLDPARLLERAADAAALTRSDNGRIGGDALALGAALGEMALTGRDKVTFFTSPSLAAYPDWLEQLIAESTGKQGRGIVPVAGEPPGELDTYGSDRFFVAIELAGESDAELDRRLNELVAAGHPVVRIRLDGKEELAGSMFDFEFAVAAAGAVLHINPFDQPDVQLAKDLARRAMAGELEGSGEICEETTGNPAALRSALDTWLGSLATGDYLGLQAYLAPHPAVSDRLHDLAGRLRDATGAATTTGFGPRFLHSTGQLHKGGPNAGLFLQLVDEPAEALPVPETDFDFRTLIAAQSRGDYLALRQRERRVVRVSLGTEPEAGLEVVESELEALL